MKYQNQRISPTPSTPSLFEEDISVLAKTKYYGCFIFNTYIMFIRPKKQTLYEPKHWFPLHLAELLDNGNETEFILKCDQHIFHCKSACVQEKQTWLEKIQLAKDYQKQHSLLPPKGIVSSLNSDFLTSFASTSRHPSDIHSIYQHQQLHKQRRVHRSNSVANYHHHPPQQVSSLSSKGIDHPAFINGNEQQKQQKCKSSLLNQKRNSVLFPLPISTSSPSILLMNDTNELHQYMEEDYIKNGLNNHLLNHSPSMNTNDANNETHSRLSKIKHRHSSLDLLSMTKNRVSIHLKSQRKNSVRETVDQKLKDVCTKDYLSSHAHQFSGRRKSSIYSSSTSSTPTSSPINTLSLKKKPTITSPLPSSSSSSQLNTAIQTNENNNSDSNSSACQTKELLPDSNPFNLPLLHISSSPTTTFMDDPSLTFTSSPMELNDTHHLTSPSQPHRLPTSYSLPIDIHQNTQNSITVTNLLSNQSDMGKKNYNQKKRNSLFLTSFQLPSNTKKPFNIFSKGFKWTRFFKNTD
ncbi:unnamed protein product [Cunninghamella blakesleeana]